MGYTHYFRLNSTLDKETINKICNDTEKLLENLSSIVCFDPDEENSQPKIDSENGVLMFNGKGSDCYEDFHLDMKRTGFNFCKTNYKPYDLAVCGTLLILAEHALDSIELSSDGDIEDYNNAIILYKQIFNKEPKTDWLNRT